MKEKRAALAVALVIASVLAAAQSRQYSDLVRGFIKVDAPVVVLTHVRIIDGTGAAPREDQTLVIRNGNIAEAGDARRISTPDGANVIDLTGRTVIPGLVMMHEHLYYPTGPGVYGQVGESFIRLYLAGGVTTMRTTGNVHGFMDLNLARLVADGQQP